MRSGWVGKWSSNGKTSFIICSEPWTMLCSVNMTQKDQLFVATVYEYYTQSGRHDLPWRQTADPYAIVVSELMLQQTQVGRVIPKYQAFIDTFPTWHQLAEAPLGQVLRAWQGLGYNRRAKLLQHCAQRVVAEYQGKMPTTRGELEALPGIGPYTAGAIMAFAYNLPVVMIETNIRTAYIHHYVAAGQVVDDRTLLVSIERTLDHANPRQWYAALMDYGSYLKQTVGNRNIQSSHYKKQPPFKGSQRAIRGTIMRELSRLGLVTSASLYRAVSAYDKAQIRQTLVCLQAEGMLEYTNRRWHLPGINEATRNKNTGRQDNRQYNKDVSKR